MKNTTYLFFLLPHAVIVTSLFWAIAHVLKVYIPSEDNKDKQESFECGFENITVGEAPKIYKNLPAFVFLIIYDVELLILLPLMLDITTSTTLNVVLMLLAIMATIIYTCLLDVELGAIEYEN